MKFSINMSILFRELVEGTRNQCQQPTNHLLFNEGVRSNLEQIFSKPRANQPLHYFDRTDLKKRNFDLGLVSFDRESIDRLIRHPSVRLHPHVDAVCIGVFKI